jgi:3-hydroxybutyryl-CoA dehydrogenase
MTQVGVVGAGVMGVGVAQNLAQSGHDAVLVDVTDAILERATRQLNHNIRMHRLLGGVGGDPATMGTITCSTDYKALSDVEFVVENVTEKFAVKEPVYRILDEVCRPDCIFLVNTSAISITRIGALTGRPAQVVGVHFMNPVPLKPAVELIPGYHSSAESVDRTRALLTSLGKEAITVNDAPGFVSNRVLMLTINEAAYLVHDQVATAEDVDRVFTSCFDHKMGPLATADLIGLDTILYSVEVLYESYADSKYRPCPLLKKMVDAGLHGRKSGRGFFTYPSPV